MQKSMKLVQLVKLEMQKLVQSWKPLSKLQFFFYEFFILIFTIVHNLQKAASVFSEIVAFGRYMPKKR